MTQQEKPVVFHRKTSGLVRAMSPWSAFVYNFLTMGVIFPWVFLWAPVAFPGCSVWLACIFAVVLELPIALAYVWLATALPRSGGDYVFQTRVFGGIVGFPVVMSGLVLWVGLMGLVLSGWLAATLGFAPLFLGLGVNFESETLVRAGVWCQSTSGVVVITVAGMIVFAGLLMAGLKYYVRFQSVIMLTTIVMIVLILVQFLRSSPDTFAEAINHFSGFVDNNPDYYRWLQNDVSSTGFDLFPKFALGATLLAAPIAWTSTLWATWSVQQGGEIKGARVFKNQAFILVGSMIAVGVCLAVIAWAEQRAVGTGFFNAASASYYRGVSASGLGIGSVLPLPGVLAMVISPNPFFTVLIALGGLFAAWQVTCNSYVGITRIMVGMSLDRMLPDWLSRVSSRLHTPVNAHVAMLIAGVIWALAYNYTNLSSLTLGVTFAGAYVFVISTLGAAVMPYRARELYLASPGARLTFFGVPLVTLIGAVGFCFGTAAEIAFLRVPGYGLSGWKPNLIVLGVFAVSLIGYFIGRSYQRGKGIDVAYAFREVPPE